jgi:hypothetical protein
LTQQRLSEERARPEVGIDETRPARHRNLTEVGAFGERCLREVGDRSERGVPEVGGPCKDCAREVGPVEVGVGENAVVWEGRVGERGRGAEACVAEASHGSKPRRREIGLPQKAHPLEDGEVIERRVGEVGRSSKHRTRLRPSLRAFVCRIVDCVADVGRRCEAEEHWLLEVRSAEVDASLEARSNEVEWRNL